LGTTIEDIAENGARVESSMDTLVHLTQELTLLDLPVSPLIQACTIFHNRLWIGRRSWLSPLLMDIIAVIGSCIPLIFIAENSKNVAKLISDPAPPYSPI